MLLKNVHIIKKFLKVNKIKINKLKGKQLWEETLFHCYQQESSSVVKRRYVEWTLRKMFFEKERMEFLEKETDVYENGSYIFVAGGKNVNESSYCVEKWA